MVEKWGHYPRTIYRTVLVFLMMFALSLYDLHQMIYAYALSSYYVACPNATTYY